jgi:hypothetical protein
MGTEIEVDLTRARTREGMAVARAKGSCAASSPSSARNRRPTWSSCTACGEHTIGELEELFLCHPFHDLPSSRTRETHRPPPAKGKPKQVRSRSACPS